MTKTLDFQHPNGTVYVTNWTHRKTKKTKGSDTLSYSINNISNTDVTIRNSKFTVPVIVSYQATDQFITRWSDKEGGTLADAYPRHWGRWVWMFGGLTGAGINRKFKQSVNKTKL